MKVFFDTNVYISEALLGQAAQQIIAATITASWRIYSSDYVLEEIEHVTRDYLGFSHRLAVLSRNRCRRRTIHVPEVTSRHAVAADAADSPILRAAIGAGVDYLVTNDSHLLDLSPYECLRIVSMAEYFDLLVHEGHLQRTG